MSIRDLHNSTVAEEALADTDIGTDTTTNGAILDTRDTIANEFIVHAGVITDGAYTVQIEIGDDPALGDAVVADPKFILGPSGSIGSTGDIITVGLKDNGLRYCRLSVVSTGTTSGGAVGATRISTRKMKTLFTGIPTN